MDKETIRHNLSKYAQMPFEWGTMDCMQFVAKTLGVEHNYKYTTEEEANVIMDRYGGMIGFLSVFFGAPGHYGMGDPVVIILKGKPYCGILLKHGVTLKAQLGVLTIDRKFIIAGWHFNG